MCTLFTSEASLRPPESKPDGLSGLKTTKSGGRARQRRTTRVRLRAQPAGFQRSAGTLPDLSGALCPPATPKASRCPGLVTGAGCGEPRSPRPRPLLCRAPLAGLGFPLGQQVPSERCDPAPARMSGGDPKSWVAAFTLSLSRQLIHLPPTCWKVPASSEIPAGGRLTSCAPGPHRPSGGAGAPWKPRALPLHKQCGEERAFTHVACETRASD